MKPRTPFIASDLEEFETEIENGHLDRADWHPSGRWPANEPRAEDVLTMLDEVLWSRGDQSRSTD